MTILESPESTWDKRFKARHYAYRDSYSVTTTVLAQLPALGLLAGYLAAGTLPAAQDPVVLYPFGTTARMLSDDNWPMGPQPPTFAEATGDFASGALVPRGQCYAREVEVYVIEDTWIRMVSLNPEYLILLAQGYKAAQITALPVVQVIVEVEHFCPANSMRTFYPTYGLYIAFRADSAAETIYISVEGNVEGGE